MDWWIQITFLSSLIWSKGTPEVCPQLDPAKVIGEPMGRDTAAAVGLATLLVRREDPDAVFAMLPADAVIQDAVALRATYRPHLRLLPNHLHWSQSGFRPSILPRVTATFSRDPLWTSFRGMRSIRWNALSKNLI